MPTLPSAIRVVAGVTILVAIAACDSTGSGQNATPETTTANLAGTSWTLVSIGATEVGDTEAGLTFDAEGGNVSGSTGCNSLSGTYSIDGTAITFGPLATTRMACDATLMAQETAVLEALAAVEGWEIDAEGSLHLTGGTELVLAPSAA